MPSTAHTETTREAEPLGYRGWLQRCLLPEKCQRDVRKDPEQVSFQIEFSSGKCRDSESWKRGQCEARPLGRKARSVSNLGQSVQSTHAVSTGDTRTRS